MRKVDDRPGQAGAAGALGGITVLDCTQMLAGPLARLRLGAPGAEGVESETPGTGECNRTHGFEDIRATGEMTPFLALNRNKRSVVINLKTADGLAVMHDLAR